MSFNVFFTCFYANVLFNQQSYVRRCTLFSQTLADGLSLLHCFHGRWLGFI